MLPQKLNLEIVTPDRQILGLEVDSVKLPGVEGYLGVLPGHAPLLARLQVGEISYRIGNSEKYLAVSGGLAEVRRESVQVLAETCEPAEEIDLDRAKRAREQAEQELKAEGSDSEFRKAEAGLKRAISRIAVHARGQ